MATDLRLDESNLPVPAPKLWQAVRPSSLGRGLLVGAVLAWFAILILVPSLALVRQVFWGGLKPFLQAMTRPDVQRAFGMSLGITALATVVNTVFGIGLALVLTRQRFWGRALVDGVVDLPFAISPIVAGLMLVVLYGPEGWLGRWRTFWSVTLPSIRWGVAYGVTLTVARSLGEFGAVLVVSGNVIGHTQTATLYIQEGVESFHPEGAYAASLVLAAISFILLVGMDFIRKHLEGGRENRP